MDPSPCAGLGIYSEDLRIIAQDAPVAGGSARITPLAQAVGNPLRGPPRRNADLKGPDSRANPMQSVTGGPSGVPVHLAAGGLGQDSCGSGDDLADQGPVREFSDVASEEVWQLLHDDSVRRHAMVRSVVLKPVGCPPRCMCGTCRHVRRFKLDGPSWAFCIASCIFCASIDAEARQRLDVFNGDTASRVARCVRVSKVAQNKSTVRSNDKPKAKTEKQPKVNDDDKEYTVRRKIVFEILNELKTPLPQIDAFATTENARFPRHWGPGGEAADAMMQDWSAAGVLWVHPPFSKLDVVTEKITVEKPKAIVIIPDWRRRTWYDKLHALAKQAYFLPRGTHVFQIGKQGLPAVPWGTWALWMDGVDTTADVGVQGGPEQCLPDKPQSSVVLETVGTSNADAAVLDVSMQETVQEAKTGGLSKAAKRRARAKKLQAGSGAQ